MKVQISQRSKNVCTKSPTTLLCKSHYQSVLDSCPQRSCTISVEKKLSCLFSTIGVKRTSAHLELGGDNTVYVHIVDKYSMKILSNLFRD